VFILKGVKVLCFDTLLQVFILNNLAQDVSADCQERKSVTGNEVENPGRELPRRNKKTADQLPHPRDSALLPVKYLNK